MSLPTDAQERKNTPIFSGVLKYFPDALAEVARVSKKGNDQHNPGQPLHWAKEKSTDEADALTRHLLQAGTRDSDGMRHSAKVAWRALAMLQREIDKEEEQAYQDALLETAAHLEKTLKEALHYENIPHADTARQGLQGSNRQEPVSGSEKLTLSGWGRRIRRAFKRSRGERVS